MAYVVLGIVALYLGLTLVTRFHDGRCRVGTGRRGGLDCSYPAGHGDAARR
jgi:hypothetical protein